jgi:hypothetical protein
MTLKILFFSTYHLLFEDTFTSKIKIHKEVTKQKELRFFFLFLLEYRRIRILVQMDPDPEPGGPKHIRILRIRLWIRIRNTDE